MGRKKIEENQKVKRFDVYIQAEKINFINENQLLPEIIKNIDVLIEEVKNNSTFDIEVWYRYSNANDKDFETHKISATNVQNAVNKANDLYKSLRAIPFAFYHEKTKYQPQNF